MIMHAPLVQHKDRGPISLEFEHVGRRLRFTNSWRPSYVGWPEAPSRLGFIHPVTVYERWGFLAQAARNRYYQPNHRQDHDTLLLNSGEPREMRTDRSLGRTSIDLVISATPFVATAIGIAGIIYGLLSFLRGDESILPIVWAVVVPIGIVPAALGVQMLLVNALRRRYDTDEYDAKDESSFL